jgi:hypothetical protein
MQDDASEDQCTDAMNEYHIWSVVVGVISSFFVSHSDFHP